MKNKFEIDRNKLNQLIVEYNKKKEKEGELSPEIEKQYSDAVVDVLGTKTLKASVVNGCYVLNNMALNLLNNKQMHYHYNNEETLKMLEGLSNYEIVGDWQHFLSVESEYLFALPKNMQEKFAENFSIGNADAKECLLNLWENKIETVGTDVIRDSSPNATNSICINCNTSDRAYLLETLREKFTCTK